MVLGVLVVCATALPVRAGEPIPGDCISDPHCFHDSMNLICVCVTPAGQVEITGTPSGGWNILVRVDAGEGVPTVGVTYNSPGQIINVIEVTGGSGAGAYVPTLSFSVGDPIVGHVRKIKKGSGIAGLDVMGEIGGNLGPTVVGADVAVEATSIDAGRANTPPGLKVRGSLTGDIILADVAPPHPKAQVSVLDIGNGGPSVGHMLASLEARGGAIDQITVAGTIGDATHLPQIGARLDIGQVIASSIRADIVAGNATTFGSEIANIRNVTTTRDVANSTGDFAGAVVANTIGPGLNGKALTSSAPSKRQVFVKGNLGDGVTDTVLQFDDPLVNTLSGGLISPIVIGGAFRANPSSSIPEVSVPTNGLPGYMVINNEFGNETWQFGATVEVGSVTLAGPGYTAAPAAVGGGSVGVAPFALYAAGCVPAHGSVHRLHVSPTCPLEGDPTCLDLQLECAAGWLTSADIRFYGPVAGPTGDTNALNRLVVEYRVLEEPGIGDWIDVSGDFNFRVVEDLTTHVRSIVRLTPLTAVTPNMAPHFFSGVEYRVRNAPAGPSTTPLRALGVAMSPVLTFDYRISTIFDCRGGFVDLFDLNEDGTVSYSDLLQWLQEQQDLNYDGNMDTIDFALLWQAIEYYNSLP